MVLRSLRMLPQLEPFLTPFILHRSDPRGYDKHISCRVIWNTSELCVWFEQFILMTPSHRCKYHKGKPDVTSRTQQGGAFQAKPTTLELEAVGVGRPTAALESLRIQKPAFQLVRDTLFEISFD